MLLSLVYLLVRRLLGTGSRQQDEKDIELLVLRHQVKVMQRQVKRSRLRRLDRLLLAAASRAMPRGLWSSFVVGPETLLRWHRELVQKKWTYKRRGRPGRPPIDPQVRDLILRLGREDPRWGYQRIRGELVKLGYDTALRGVHHQKILRELGIVPVNMVAAAETIASKTLKRKIKRREKTVHVEDKDVRLPDASTVTLRLFSKAGAIGLMRPTEAGELEFVPLTRKRTHRMRAADSGLYRWYNDYRLPEHIGGGQITVRLHQNEADRKRKFNRTENVRPIPPSDPDFPRLYGRRNDSESLNRSLEDTMFLGRAHSLGWRRQQVEMLGWAVMVNALTMARHRSTEGLEAAA